MPSVLIAGCGYVGMATGQLFANRGWQVSGWVRSRISATESTADAIPLRAVDISESAALEVNRFAVDVIVHCASSGGGTVDSYRRVYKDGARNLTNSFPKSRLIFTSSTSVYAQHDGSLVDEISAAEPTTETGKILREAEEIVLAHDGIVLRVAGIYGPGRSFLLSSVTNGSVPDDNRFVNQAHRDDVAAAIFFVANQEVVAKPRIFNVVDNEPRPRQEIVGWLSRRLGVTPSSTAPVQQRRVHSHKRVSNFKLRKLGWAPLYPSYVEGFERSVLPAAERTKNPIGRS